MRIAVLGRSLPGLMAALHYIRQGHEVMLIGKDDARSNEALGAQYLWRTHPLEDYFAEIDFVPNPEAVTKFVRYVVRAPSGGWGVVNRDGWHDSDYCLKVESHQPPCLGRTDFQVVKNGFEDLKNHIVGQIPSNVFCDGLVSAVSTVNGLAIFIGNSWIVVDGILNTLNRGLFEKLAGTSIGETSKLVYLYRSDKTVYDGLDLKNGIVAYDANRDIPWHRSTWSETNGFIYESMAPIPERPDMKFVGVIPGKVHVPDKSALVQRLGVHHLGRWAECNSELMVSDVPRKLQYLRFD